MEAMHWAMYFGGLGSGYIVASFFFDRRMQRALDISISVSKLATESVDNNTEMMRLFVGGTPVRTQSNAS